MCEPGGGHGGWLPSISRRSIACIPRDGQGTAAPAAPPSPAQGAAARPAWRAGARGYAPSAAGASGTSPPLWAGAGCRSVPRKAPLYPRAPLGEEAAGGLRLFPASRQPLCLMPLLWKMSHPAVGKSVLALINKRLCPGVPVSPPRARCPAGVRSPGWELPNLPPEEEDSAVLQDGRLAGKVASRPWLQPSPSHSDENAANQK